MRKPKVGDELYLVIKLRKLTVKYTCEVTKVGRKYFTVGFGLNLRGTTVFHISNWRQKAEYTPDYHLYESADDYKCEMKLGEFRSLFDRSGDWMWKLDLAQLEEIAKIAGLSLEDA